MTNDNVIDYLAYLQRSCGCEDRHEFWTPEGEPDIGQARAFAESIRLRLGSFLDDYVAVEQRVNVVTVRVTKETSPTAA